MSSGSNPSRPAISSLVGFVPSANRSRRISPVRPLRHHARELLTVPQIAEDLHLSVATVSTHRAHILAKMSMTTTAALISYAVRNRLID